jgi:hypothetical protein
MPEYVSTKKVIRIAVGTMILLLFVAICVFAAGRDGVYPCERGIWRTLVTRLWLYQQLLSGMFALFAGAFVLFAAREQRKGVQAQIDASTIAADQHNQKTTLQIARAIRAEIQALIIAMDEFGPKLRAAVFIASSKPDVFSTIPLPYSSIIYESLSPKIGRLDEEEAAEIIALYAAYYVYKDSMSQPFSLGRMTVDDAEQTIRNLSEEFRRRCINVVDSLSKLISRKEIELQKLAVYA